MTTDPAAATDRFDLTEPRARERFIRNVLDAKENGYEEACVWCGVGLAGDGCDLHEDGCPYPGASYA